jgi:hypothetical protein
VGVAANWTPASGVNRETATASKMRDRLRILHLPR